LPSLNFDGAGLDFTQIVRSAGTDLAYDAWAYIMTSADVNWPGVGTKTLYWTFTAAPTEVGTVIIFFVKGIDVNNPIWPSVLSGVEASDLSFGFEINYSAYDSAWGIYGQEVLAESWSDTTAAWGLCYEYGEDEIVLTSSNALYNVGIAFSLRAIPNLNINVAENGVKCVQIV
jgi:hypothetical protein